VVIASVRKPSPVITLVKDYGSLYFFGHRIAKACAPRRGHDVWIKSVGQPLERNYKEAIKGSR